MNKIRADDLNKVELSREEAIKFMGEDVAPQFDEHENRCIKGEIILNLKFGKLDDPIEDTLQLIVFVTKELIEDQPKVIVNSHIDKALLKELEHRLSEPHPTYGEILSYEVVK